MYIIRVQYNERGIFTLKNNHVYTTRGRYCAVNMSNLMFKEYSDGDEEQLEYGKSEWLNVKDIGGQLYAAEDTVYRPVVANVGDTIIFYKGAVMKVWHKGLYMSNVFSFRKRGSMLRTDGEDICMYDMLHVYEGRLCYFGEFERHGVNTEYGIPMTRNEFMRMLLL